MSTVKIEPSWGKVLQPEFEKPYFADIKSFLVQEKEAGKTIYPPGSLIFNAFQHTPFNQVKVLLLGQDPYHQPGQAMGLSFSVPQGVTIPASLRNVYKELQSDVGFVPPKHGNLEKWAAQGVFLLNAMLTVEASKPASHQTIGWQSFTDAVIKTLSDQHQGIIFLLWGSFAHKKEALIDTTRHHILKAAHPSPLAGNAFLGCRHFSQTNNLLVQQGKEPIDWQL
jgi:uracil-DNA glycosylase